MKKLVTAKTIEEFAANHGTVFQIDDNTLITPSAKDAARSLNITFAHGETEQQVCSNASPLDVNPEAQQCPCVAEAEELPFDKETVVSEVIKVLKEMDLLDRIKG